MLDSWIPDRVGLVSTQLKLEKWQDALSNHPYKAFTELLLEGIRKGFRIGYNVRKAPLKQKSQVT